MEKRKKNMYFISVVNCSEVGAFEFEMRSGILMAGRRAVRVLEDHMVQEVQCVQYERKSTESRFQQTTSMPEWN